MSGHDTHQERAESISDAAQRIEAAADRLVVALAGPLTPAALQLCASIREQLEHATAIARGLEFDLGGESPEPPAARVARGAELLDRWELGWWERIDLGMLSIENCSACVLGQLWRGQARGRVPYVVGVEHLSGQTISSCGDWAVRHGFCPTGVDGGPVWQAESAALDAAWVSEIARRRASASAVTWPPAPERTIVPPPERWSEPRRTPEDPVQRRLQADLWYELSLQVSL